MGFLDYYMQDQCVTREDHSDMEQILLRLFHHAAPIASSTSGCALFALGYSVLASAEILRIGGPILPYSTYSGPTIQRPARANASSKVEMLFVGIVEACYMQHVEPDRRGLCH